MERNAWALLVTLTLGALPGCGLSEGPPPEGVDVVQGTVEIAAPLSSAATTSAFIPFTLPTAGEVHVGIDWQPPSNRVSFAVSHGACSTAPCPSEIDMGPFTDGAQQKPLSGQSVLPAGPCTLRIDNWGRTAVTTTYNVRLVAR
jgi:hypothetical protein